MRLLSHWLVGIAPENNSIAPRDSRRQRAVSRTQCGSLSLFVLDAPTMRRNQVTALQFSNGGVDCASPTVDELISYANVLRGAHQSGVESMPLSLSPTRWASTEPSGNATRPP